MTQLTQLLTAIRRGKIANGADAAAHLGISSAGVWRLLRQARAEGWQIESDSSRNAGPRRPWRIVRKGNGK